ncbi:hypothetical protein NNO07_16100 [Pseudomonas resinovorans]|uniref:Uncharacterized protein n=1 Tax=Metapseudomonas resinovorans TaxID=53412 RepID=A0ABT4Y6U8_METRE|nr:hypothetical protein [Pseudomonas resinovorans]MDA8484595.1 hypothetical protein [Pseudomonas resinovorans]
MDFQRRMAVLAGLAVSTAAVLWAASFPCADLQTAAHNNGHAFEADWCKAPLMVRRVVLQLLDLIEEDF